MTTTEPIIPKYYAGKKILVTGGTGFLGKMLIWKLLQSCPLLDTIYMLVRPKYGKTMMSRRNEVFSNMMFDDFKKNHPEILKKVIFIPGDVGEEGIGLSQQHRDLLIDQVSLIFHSAAVLKMDAELKFAVNVNTTGTLRLLKLAEQMKKLEAFVHISTAYCCSETESVEEKLYPSEHNPYDIINLTNWMDSESLRIITPKLLHPLPNTYTYSKRLTESLFFDFMSKIPIIIARPTTVLPSADEPVPGWVDGMNGPTGMFIAGGKGILRSTMLNPKVKMNFVPVDVAVNGIITLPWANCKDNLLKEIAVYNVGETEHDPFVLGDLANKSFDVNDEYPFEKVLWHPNRNVFESNFFLHHIKVLFSHWLPAYIIDFVMTLIGQKPFLVYVYTKLHQGEKVLRYFLSREWLIANEKLLRISDSMNDADRKIYPVTMKNVTDDALYVKNAILFIHKYFYHEDLSRPKVESARRKMKLLYVLDRVVLILKYIFLFKMLTRLYYLFLDIISAHQ